MTYAAPDHKRVCRLVKSRYPDKPLVTKVSMVHWYNEGSQIVIDYVPERHSYVDGSGMKFYIHCGDLHTTERMLEKLFRTNMPEGTKPKAFLQYSIWERPDWRHNAQGLISLGYILDVIGTVKPLTNDNPVFVVYEIGASSKRVHKIMDNIYRGFTNFKLMQDGRVIPHSPDQGYTLIENPNFNPEGLSFTYDGRAYRT